MYPWIEIFKTGTHTDASGTTKNWSREDIDTIVSQYSSAGSEAPFVIGHPETNAPAFGWVGELKREDDTLFAKPSQISPELIDLISGGYYTKRSIALNEDGSLRHVGFLGAVPPAVKGLADVTFSEDTNFSVIELPHTENHEDEPEEFNIVPIAPDEPAGDNSNTPIAAYNQNESTGEQYNLHNEFKSYLTEKTAEGFLTPAQSKHALQFVEYLIKPRIQFNDRASEVSGILNCFRDFVNTLPKQIEFSEIAVRSVAEESKGKLSAWEIARREIRKAMQ